MNSAAATGQSGRIPIQPAVQPPMPGAPAPNNPPPAPRMRSVAPTEDPRGTKRGREGGEIVDHEHAGEPVAKQARNEKSTTKQHPQQKELIAAIEDNKVTEVRSLLKRYPELI